MTGATAQTTSALHEALRGVYPRQHEIVQMVVSKHGPEFAEDAVSEAFLEVLEKPERFDDYGRRLGRKLTSDDAMSFVVRRAQDRATDMHRKKEGRQKDPAQRRSFVSYDDQIGLPADPDLEEVGVDRSGEYRSKYDELLMRLPENLGRYARVRFEMEGRPVAEMRERLGLSASEWTRTVARYNRLIDQEMEALAAGSWCQEHRARIAELVRAQMLGEADGPEGLHLQHCGACYDYALFLAAGIRERAAVVLPPVPALAGAGFLSSIGEKVLGWFSSGEGATTVVGGGAAGGGILTAGGATALKVCGGAVAVGCAAVFAGPAVVEKVKADPKPPAVARTAPAPSVAARPIATVAPVVATPSAAQIRSQERAQRRAAGKAKRTARREKRSSADAAFKVSSAARSARSAAPTQSDKALGLSSAPAQPAAPASAGSGGGGGAGDAPTSADKAFGLSTGGG